MDNSAICCKSKHLIVCQFCSRATGEKCSLLYQKETSKGTIDDIRKRWQKMSKKLVKIPYCGKSKKHLINGVLE